MLYAKTFAIRKLWQKCRFFAVWDFQWNDLSNLSTNDIGVNQTVWGISVDTPMMRIP